MTSRTLSLGALLLPVLVALSPAVAAPITYTLTGYVQVTAAGNQVNTSFTWTVNADTANITTPSAGRLQVPATSNSMVFTGAGTTALANVNVSLNTATGQISFGNASGGIGLTNTQLQKWDMASPIGPLTGPNYLVSGTITTDTGTVITLTGVANTNSGPSPTFQASQTPTITNVTNSASSIQPGLPNSGIAQGAIFTVFGSNLGPSTLAIAPAAFQSTTLSNTSIAVTVNGTKVNALMYYTSTTQLAALLPSNTPTGTGTIAVTYNGQTSASYPITVVASNAGIFTVGANGQGAAIVTYADYSLVSPAKAANCGGPNTTCGAANPGDYLILWATGLGPVSGSDATGAGLGVNMSSLPLTVWLGGVQTPVTYQGRSGCCIGEDQIVFQVPNNVPTGCAVPLLIQIGSLTSNVTVLPVASGSRTCPATNPALASAGVTNFQSTVSTGPIVVGSIAMTRDPNPVGQTGYTDNIKFQFTKAVSVPAGYVPFVSTYLDEPAHGTCLVYNSLNTSSNYGLSVTTTGGDAGTSFTVSGPGGSKSITGNAGQFTAVLSSTGAFLSPGAFTATGKGGADVGSFNAALTVPAAPTLVSPVAQATPLTVTRSNGLPVTWSGGASSGYIQIQVQAPTDSTYTNGATAICTVAASAGTFTVPAYVMQTLPTSSFASIQVQQMAEAAFTAQGMPYALFSSANLPAGMGNVTLK